MTMHNKESTLTLTGLLTDLVAGHLQSWGLLDVVTLFAAPERPDYAQFVSPLEHLKLVQVPTYGTLVLHNTAQNGTLIAPMHIGFFQVGAQNHATSRALILAKDETLRVEDCFCIQQTQGGLLKEAQQRFIILPLSLRKAALAKRNEKGFSRLWNDIEVYNRRYGITRRGHLERYLRPYFSRLLPFRHAFEVLPQQIGAAYFVAGRLIGIEVAPNAGYWSDIGPILNIYCYGSAALLAERYRWKTTRNVVNLDGLVDLDDLKQRLVEKRLQEEQARIELLETTSNLAWNCTVETEAQELQVVSLAHEEWAGQMVKRGTNMVYMSVFRDVIDA